METKVAVVMGSDSDWSTMQGCVDMLSRLGMKYEIEIMSCHRTPARVHEFATQAAERGFRVIIAGAGMAASLAGIIAANTTLPVIGVPVDAGPLKGVDALLSTVQMPPGVPVATVGIGAPGAKNAACLAAEIVGLSDKTIADNLRAFKVEQAAVVDRKNQELREKLKRD